MADYAGGLSIAAQACSRRSRLLDVYAVLRHWSIEVMTYSILALQILASVAQIRTQYLCFSKLLSVAARHACETERVSIRHAALLICGSTTMHHPYRKARLFMRRCTTKDQTNTYTLAKSSLCKCGATLVVSTHRSACRANSIGKRHSYGSKLTKH
jgi:hypothetical protein